MTAAKSLKEQNAWLIRVALLVHAVAFAWVVLDPLPLAQFMDEGSLKRMQGFLTPGSISLGLIALTRLVLLGLIPGTWRDRLVHWRWSDPLPGSRAFTKYGPADQRVDMKKLKKKYGALPTKPAEQGRAFYGIYKAHANAIGVLDAHKSYLAARDIATINFLLLLLLSPLAAFWIGFGTRAALYALALFAAYAVMSLAAQVYACRLVQNTLAIASH
jgi:hypothetical protein